MRLHRRCVYKSKKEEEKKKTQNKIKEENLIHICGEVTYRYRLYVRVFAPKRLRTRVFSYVLV